ncbi:hypothetical protein OESDEN_23298 [Oesophagostomum dentatum]|uniref:Uncharacterized protein n=1 Tax=Oesophagostomum dentatum TaxID=61180 RepID=A0A0B1S0U3_OESDE|nr:hypothetical protein OESDEN_23298 [Oesophagostomum dentatum]
MNSMLGEGEELRTAHPCVSEPNLSTQKDFMKIKLTKDTPSQIRRAIVSEEKNDAPFLEAKPSKSQTRFTHIHQLVAELPDVQAFKAAEEKRTELGKSN